MKMFFLPILTLFLLSSTSSTNAQATGDGPTISIKGDASTEQSAKLELIRILQERLNKLTVSQLNARVLVSTGVKNYYKVNEILTMQKGMYGYRSVFVVKANKIESGNPGFAASGGGLSYKYLLEFNAAVDKAGVIKDQLMVVVKSGTPIVLPTMPTFSITPSSGSDPGADLAQAMQGILSSYGVNSQDDFDKLPQATQDEIKAKMADAAKPLQAAIQQQIKNSNSKVLATLGNIVGGAIGIPGAGNMLVGIASGNVSALAGLVGSIVDNFQIPPDYYDSNTLKLTDSERIKIIDELHVRMSELYQQVAAMGASMSAETKTRYNEISQPRNDAILYGPKK